MKTKQRFILRWSRGTPFEYPPCLSLRHSKLCLYNFVIPLATCITKGGEKRKRQIPLFPPFSKGDDNKSKFSSLKKRGQGRFIPFKSPFVPLFQRGKIIRKQIPLFPPFSKGDKKNSPLWKRGVRGDFILSNPPSSPFFKGK